MKELLLNLLPTQGQLVALLWGIIVSIFLVRLLNTDGVRDLLANCHDNYVRKINKKKQQ